MSYEEFCSDGMLLVLPKSSTMPPFCNDLSCELAACTRKCNRDSKEYPL